MKTIEICIVEPADYNLSTASSLPLTFFDLKWLKFLPLERLFYYEFPYPTTHFFDHVMLFLVIAESDDAADFDHLSSFELCETTECRHLVPHLTISQDQASVLALHVTLFPNYGFSIGMTSHHTVLDGELQLCLENLGLISAKTSRINQWPL
ncbi:hypothetical protein K1719_031951 [Acacia pycnantha]|nr:hypothetical protein K1719_031951 [Acacia pycnantha]